MIIAIHQVGWYLLNKSLELSQIKNNKYFTVDSYIHYSILSYHLYALIMSDLFGVLIMQSLLRTFYNTVWLRKWRFCHKEGEGYIVE